VLFVLPDLPRSGAATRTAILAEGLARAGARVCVLSFLAADPDLIARLRESGAETLSVPRGLRRLWFLLRTSADPVVHAAMPTAGLAGLVLARMFRLPLVYSYTNCPHRDRPFRRRSPADSAKAALERVMARRADVLHAVSPNVAEQLRRLFPASTGRVRVVMVKVAPPLGGQESRPVPVSQDRPAPVAGRPEAYPRLLAIGRLVPHKRFDDAIRVLALVRCHWPGAVLVIVGSGPELARLGALAAELAVAEHVRLPGTVRSPAEYLTWADVLVHPSLYEGYPRVVAEARAFGLPVVSVDTPYGRELARSGGQVRLARPCDAGALAQEVVNALVWTAPRADQEASDDDWLEPLLAMYSEAARRLSSGRAWRYRRNRRQWPSSRR
ncbi:MAG TPA: glycosyltransferase family 4 protein, partial [Streptosporangiaceae bacterium]